MTAELAQVLRRAAQSAYRLAIRAHRAHLGQVRQRLRLRRLDACHTAAQVKDAFGERNAAALADLIPGGCYLCRIRTAHFYFPGDFLTRCVDAVRFRWRNLNLLGERRRTEQQSEKGGASRESADSSQGVSYPFQR